MQQKPYHGMHTKDKKAYRKNLTKKRDIVFQ